MKKKIAHIAVQETQRKRERIPVSNDIFVLTVAAVFGIRKGQMHCVPSSGKSFSGNVRL
jgi:hypothetical protein